MLFIEIKNLSVTYLRIKPNQQTFYIVIIKKTNFIIVSVPPKYNCLWKIKQKFAPSKLMIRTGFHQIKNVGKNV